MFRSKSAIQMTSYYDIPEPAWLFRDKIVARTTEDKKWTPNEESVRQWCLHELIRSCGVRVDCLEIERRVKVARERKPNPAIIVVSGSNPAPLRQQQKRG